MASTEGDQREIDTSSGEIDTSSDQPGQVITPDQLEDVELSPPFERPPRPARAVGLMASSVWYVDPRVTGDGGDGSEADPWSLGHALKGARGGIHAGDTVLLRGGTYASSVGYTVQNVSAEAGAPVTFQAYPGEVPLIDGAIAAFQTPGNDAWVPDPEAPSGQNVWHSKELFASNRAPYLGMIELQGELITLATHIDRARLTSSEDRWTDNLTHYVGPGIAFKPDPSDATMGRIYIRLDNTSDEAQVGRDVVRIDDFDPRHHAIHIGAQQLLGLDIQASHLRFVGLHFRGHWGCWGVVVAGVRGLVFEDCVGEPQRFVARLGPAEDVRILGGSYTAHMPSSKWWASVVDLHTGSPAPAAPAKMAFDLGRSSQVEIGPSRRTGQRMLLRQFFDGMIASGPVRDVEVHGVWFDEIWDDTFTMTRDLRNVDYHDNLHYGAGPSRTDENEGTPDGSIHIHDNVIDTTIRPIFRHRGGHPGTPAVREAIAFSSHWPADSRALPWRLYHNTVVTGDQPGSDDQIGVGQFGLNRDPAQPRHEVYNNIYVVPSGQPVATRVSSISTVPGRGVEIYDGNCFFSNGAWTPAKPPYHPVHTSTSKPEKPDPGTWPLGAFRESQAVRDSQTYYRRCGWESSAIEANPLLDDAYLPVAPEAQVGSVDLSLTGWPGTEPYRAQRGARLTAPLPAGAIPESGGPR